METKFRPIPITILDFLGVLIPGFLWLILLAKTYWTLTDPSARHSGVVDAWSRINDLAGSGGGWLGPLSVVLASLVAGYTLKPLAMAIAGWLTRPLFALLPQAQGARWRKMVFPFSALFAGKEPYKKVCKILAAVTEVDDVERLPGTAPFAAAKRYLHATAPALWEESERMEAEVRMAGALFLAALYSTLLHVALGFARSTGAWVWALFSFAGALALAFGFNILRLREVGYTYLNLLLAEGARRRGGLQGPGARGEAPDED